LSCFLFAGLSNRLLEKKSEALAVMQIFVGSTAYQVDSAETVDTLKHQIENREFLPVSSFCLMMGGKVLEEGATLEGNGVSEEDELEITLAVPAGMRKKWKKKRMRRLRRKVRFVAWKRPSSSPVMADPITLTPV
jgi:hypothetical protein